ncbi:MAG: hypothetical protein QXS51_05640 [Thermoproteota archaeon]
MDKIRKNVEGLIIITILVSLSISIVNAVAFVYYPTVIGFEEGHTLLFKKGSNADMPDLEDTIMIDLEEHKGISVVVHPSRRGVTYYKDLIRIVNVNTHVCKITFIVDTAFRDPIKEAYLILTDVSTSIVIGVIDLKKTGGIYNSILLDAGSEARIDLRFIVSSDTEGSGTALIQVIC